MSTRKCAWEPENWRARQLRLNLEAEGASKKTTAEVRKEKGNSGNYDPADEETETQRGRTRERLDATIKEYFPATARRLGK